MSQRLFNVLAIAAGALLSLTLNAADVSRLLFDDVRLFYVGRDATNCVQTQLLVEGRNSKQQLKSTRNLDRTIRVSYSRRDICNQITLNLAQTVVSADAAQFGVRGNVNRAFIIANVPVTDSRTGRSYTISVDMELHGIEPVSQVRETLWISTEAGLILQRAQGKARDAEAVGEILDGSVDLTSGLTNADSRIGQFTSFTRLNL